MNIEKHTTAKNTKDAAFNEVITITLTSPADKQILDRALQAYSSQYLAEHYGKDTWNEHHYKAIGAMKDAYTDKYLEFTIDNFYIGLRLLSKKTGKIWTVKGLPSGKIGVMMTNGDETMSFDTARVIAGLNSYGSDSTWEIDYDK